MERKRQSQNNAEVRDNRGKVELERRYGEIGISAVAAASQPHGKRKKIKSARIRASVDSLKKKDRVHSTLSKAPPFSQHVGHNRRCDCAGFRGLAPRNVDTVSARVAGRAARSGDSGAQST